MPEDVPELVQLFKIFLGWAAEARRNARNGRKPWLSPRERRPASDVMRGQI